MGEPYLALVFANTKQRVVEIADYLKHRVKGRCIMATPARNGNGHAKFKTLISTVATDLAAGIDIDGFLTINDGIPDDLDYFIHRAGRTGVKVCRNGDHSIHRGRRKGSALEDMGIVFKPKQIKNGEVVDSFDRNRRKKRGPRAPKISGAMAGRIQKEKRTVKPGYKKKIKKAINKEQWFESRIQQRQNHRKARKNKKASSQRYK